MGIIMRGGIKFRTTKVFWWPSGWPGGPSLLIVRKRLEKMRARAWFPDLDTAKSWKRSGWRLPRPKQGD